LPRSLHTFLATPLFSTRAKFALLREPFIWRTPPELEESVAQFVVRRLGREFLDYAIEPFVAGIYAGDPLQLSLPAAFPRLHALEQRHGSLVKSQIFGARERAQRAEKARSVASSFSFAHGLQTLTDALAHSVRVRTQTRAMSLRREADAFIVTAECGGAASEIRARAVVLAVPADCAALLVREFAPDAARALAEIPYAPVASVVTVYRRADVAHALDGFGFLAPRIEQRRILGTLFSSTMFAGRVGADRVLLTTFVGGQREPALPWPRAIPQYTLGHLQRIVAAETAESVMPGLFLCSSYRGGVAVGDCIASGCRTADRVANHLESSRIR
jgi:oxygen-dependent protoporphyrinogen oxidase